MTLMATMNTDIELGYRFVQYKHPQVDITSYLMTQWKVVKCNNPIIINSHEPFKYVVLKYLKLPTKTCKISLALSSLSDFHSQLHHYSNNQHVYYMKVKLRMADKSKFHKRRKHTWSVISLSVCLSVCLSV